MCDPSERSSDGRPRPVAATFMGAVKIPKCEEYMVLNQQFLFELDSLWIYYVVCCSCTRCRWNSLPIVQLPHQLSQNVFLTLLSFTRRHINNTFHPYFLSWKKLALGIKCPHFRQRKCSETLIYNLLGSVESYFSSL